MRGRWQGSWRTSSLVKRDIRQSGDGPDIPNHRANKRKNTKRWCRGVAGREHVYDDRCHRCRIAIDEALEQVASGNISCSGSRYHTIVKICTVCHKQIWKNIKTVNSKGLHDGWLWSI